MLLTDEQATVAAIRERFEQLAACDPDDVVVIAFSGHGTETHELVGHDTDPYDLARTTIPLTTLGEWCSRIPSRRLLIVLDFCFSGGMGAKALQVEGVARDIQSVEGKLNQISGQGRVVKTPWNIFILLYPIGALTRTTIVLPANVKPTAGSPGGMR